MKLTVKIPYKFKQNIKEKPQETTLNFLMLSINSKYPQGIDGGYKRIFARIQNKLDEAIDKDLKNIDIEQAELDLIKNAVKEAKVPVHFVSNFVLLEDEVEKVEKLVEKEKK
jgi:hypothetical protein